MAVEINDSAVLAAFNRLLKAGEQPAPWLNAVGRVLKTRVQMGFHTGTDPYGQAWKPLRSRQGQPLRNTGRLMNSVTYQVEGNSVVIGTNVKYAPTHQFAATIVPKEKPALRFMVNGHWVSVKKVTIPARPMFPLNGLPPLWQEDVLAELGDFLNKQIQG
jgi:phage virion morphogenesis protein